MTRAGRLRERGPLENVDCIAVAEVTKVTLKFQRQMTGQLFLSKAAHKVSSTSYDAVTSLHIAYTVYSEKTFQQFM